MPKMACGPPPNGVKWQGVYARVTELFPPGHLPPSNPRLNQLIRRRPSQPHMPSQTKPHPGEPPVHQHCVTRHTSAIVRSGRVHVAARMSVHKLWAARTEDEGHSTGWRRGGAGWMGVCAVPQGTQITTTAAAEEERRRESTSGVALDCRRGSSPLRTGGWPLSSRLKCLYIMMGYAMVSILQPAAAHSNTHTVRSTGTLDGRSSVSRGAAAGHTPPPPGARERGGGGGSTT
jgi:hypothetical protein